MVNKKETNTVKGCYVNSRWQLYKKTQNEFRTKINT